MVWLQKLLIVVQVLSALAMIGLILIQHGKGADMGAAFGSGSSGSLFGASGGANFLSRSTAVLATLFFCSTLGLAFLGNVRPTGSQSVLDKVTQPAPTAPAAQDAAPAGSASAPVPGAPVSSGSVGSPVNQIPSK
ncbi:MAG: preprotein translocase subunit SecG [Betaproteobacteria bacterium]|jgi:preprotein translocase subunit SecG|nr:preprotein translocase subunit SecG [Betaproteobacteria bacterium]NBP43877.1 preprotein translocase subunit SecG [Betaproteobacteria bacterium]